MRSFLLLLLWVASNASVLRSPQSRFGFLSATQLSVRSEETKKSSVQNVTSAGLPDKELMKSMRNSDFGRSVLSQLQHAPCIHSSDAPTIWIVYHNEEGRDAADRLVDDKNNFFEVRPLDNGDVPGAEEKTSGIIPALGSYGGLMNENGAIMALGFGLAACAHAPRWVGTASWKAVEEVSDSNECRTLPNLVKRPMMSHFAQKKNETEVPEDAVLYWFKDPETSLDLKVHIEQNPFLHKKEVMITDFFHEVLDINATRLFSQAHSEFGAALPWKNWFMTSPSVLLALARLQAMLYSWIDARYPFKEVGCSTDLFSMPSNSMWSTFNSESQRCWGYVGEYVTMLFFMSDAELLQVDCEDPTPFHAKHDHDITERISEVWAAMEK